MARRARRRLVRKVVLAAGIEIKAAVWRRRLRDDQRDTVVVKSPTGVETDERWPPMPASLEMGVRLNL